MLSAGRLRARQKTFAHHRNKIAATVLTFPLFRIVSGGTGSASLAANLGCVVMFAPPLCRTIGHHAVSIPCRHGGRQMIVLLLRQLLISE
jgi:hypothetical protein